MNRDIMFCMSFKESGGIPCHFFFPRSHLCCEFFGDFRIFIGEIICLAGIEFDLERDHRLLRVDDDEVELTIGGGLAEVKLDTGSGGIRISQ